MKANKADMPKGIPQFLRKLIEDKRAIKEAISQKKPLDVLAKENNIHFAKPL